jgi:hypothetical protein
MLLAYPRWPKHFNRRIKPDLPPKDPTPIRDSQRVGSAQSVPLVFNGDGETADAHGGHKRKALQAPVESDGKAKIDG